MLKGAVNVQIVNGHTGVNHLFKVSKCEFSHHPNLIPLYYLWLHLKMTKFRHSPYRPRT